MGLLFARRRPLLRGAMLAGGGALAYQAGKRRQADIQHEYEAAELGAIAGALIGWGAGGEEGLEVGAEAGTQAGAAAAEEGMFRDEEVWYIADAIPERGSAAVALVEHRWAVPLRDATRRAGGLQVADEWVHPRDLVAAGLRSASADD